MAKTGQQQPHPKTVPINTGDLMSTRPGDKPGSVRNQITGPGGTTKLINTGIDQLKAEVWVKKWVDYSSKYGLGYYLSNEVTGVFFNDSTKIVLDPNGYHFDYYERRSSDR
jgi:hypothetical protein